MKRTPSIVAGWLMAGLLTLSVLLVGCGTSTYSLSARAPVAPAPPAVTLAHKPLAPTERSVTVVWPPPIATNEHGAICPGSLPHGRHRLTLTPH